MSRRPSTATANSVLDAIRNATSFSTPTSCIQLHTADPAAAGTTAIADNATQPVPFGNAASGTMSHDTAIIWTSGVVDTSKDYTTGPPGTLLPVGTFIMLGTMTATAVTTGDTFTIPIGDLDLTNRRRVLGGITAGACYCLAGN